MGARTRGIANNILSDGLDATDGLSGALSSDNIANASVTNVTSTPAIGGVFEKVASDPPSPTEGDIWYNTTSNTVKGYVLSPRSAAWATGGTLNTNKDKPGFCGTQTAGLATGGYTTGNISSAEEYNGSTWTSVTSMPISRRTQIGFGIQTNAVIAGGQAPPNAAASEVLGYDGTTCTSLNNLNAARSDGGSSGDAASAIIFNGFSGGG